MVILCNALCVHCRPKNPTGVSGFDLFWGVHPPALTTVVIIMYRFTHWTLFLNCV